MENYDTKIGSVDVDLAYYANLGMMTKVKCIFLKRKKISFSLEWEWEDELNCGDSLGLGKPGTPGKLGRVKAEPEFIFGSIR